MCAMLYVIAGKWSFNNQEQLILEFEEAIQPATNVSFAVHFNYTLKKGLSGFYRSSYKGAPLLPNRVISSL